MDLSEAQLEPYRALHYFHEKLNVHVKSSTAAVVLLADVMGKNEDPRALGRLIEQAHPAWGKAPIHEFDIGLYKRLYNANGEYAIIALFSALDDFIIGMESDVARYENMGNKIKLNADDNEKTGNDRLLTVCWRHPLNAALTPVL